MNLYPIDRREVATMWSTVEDWLEVALLKGDDEIDIRQLRALLVNGAAQLLVAGDEHGPAFAVACEFQDFPNYRACHVIALGGRRSMGDTTWDQFRRWARSCGCSKLQAWCGDSMVRLLRRRGMRPSYTVVRSDL